MSESAIKKFNNNQWKKLESFNFSKRTVFDLIKEGGSVLDIGCGDGLILEHLAKEKNCAVTGVDISEKAVEICKSRGLRCLCADITDKLPFQNDSVDYILLIDVLEHMFLPADVLSEANRITKKYVCISVPNFVSLPARLQVLLGRVPENNTPRDGHVYWMTRKVIRNLLEKTGFDIEKEIVNTFWENVPVVKFVTKFLSKVFPSLFGLSFIILARKNEATILTAEQNDITEYYDDMYSKKSELRPFGEYVQKFSFLGQTRPGQTMLDVGCGNGYLLKVAADAKLLPYGLEISSKALELAKKIAPKSQLMLGQGEKLPYADNMFDYVVSMGSLEHFTDVKKALQEMVRVAKPTGKFLLMVPNRKYIFWNIGKAKGTGQIQETTKSHHEWQSFFERNGLDIISVGQDYWPKDSMPWFVKTLNPIRLAKRFAYKTVWQFMPLPYTYQFIFLCQKKKA